MHTVAVAPLSVSYTHLDVYKRQVGYQWQINDHWKLDLYVGGGHSEGFYKGFHKEIPGIRYDPDPTREYNRSGEWVPYKGGLMISYRLK